jgi:hypothetical protein
MLSSANLILENFVVSTLLVKLKLLYYEEVSPSKGPFC